MERKFDWRTRVIAVDFDGCLSISEYPEEPKPEPFPKKRTGKSEKK